MCPFHGFTYDVAGTCVSTPTAPPTPACRLDLFPVEEVNGFVFAWFDQAAREPRWRLPVVDEAGWTPTSTHLYRIRSHPQETTENTIDLNHLRFLHVHPNIMVVSPVAGLDPLSRRRRGGLQNRRQISTLEDGSATQAG